MTNTRLASHHNLASNNPPLLNDTKRGFRSQTNSSGPKHARKRASGATSQVQNNRYMPGIDGLRTLAVFAVIAYHLNFQWASGGLLGVGVFFTLSGYLITDLLIAQWRRNGKLELKDFWLRRARRLLPAVLVMLVVVVAWVTLFAGTQLASLRADVIAALLYVSNWWFIFHHVSYFARFGPPSPLGHLWSLAVEEQFYLIWPLLLFLGIRFTPRRGKLAGLTLGLAAVSALTMALLYQPGTDPSRVYYGTDTRAFGLLIGAALAIVWPSQKFSGAALGKARWALDLVGLVGLSVVILMIWRTNQYDVFLYRGGLVLLSVATAATLVALVHPRSLLSRLLGLPPLRWLGVRSYGIYLWHYPIILLTSPVVNTNGVNVPRALLQIAFTVVIAALSFRFVEQPIRYGGVKSLWAPMRLRRGKRRRFTARRWIGSTSAVFALVVFCVGMFAGPVSVETVTSLPRVISLVPKTPVASRPRQQDVVPATANASVDKVQSAGNRTTGTQSGQRGILTKSATGQTPAGNQGQAPAGSSAGQGTTSGGLNGIGPVAPQSGQGITAIGDSVLIDASPYLKKLFPGIVINAQVGRQVYQAQAVVEQLRSQNELGQRVIIELGTNGPFTEQQMVSLLNSLGPVKQILLVNTRVPRPWQDLVNSTLANVAQSFPNVTIVDWYAASAGKNAYFYPDGVHLNPEGSQFYASLVAMAVKPLSPSSGN